MKGFSGTLRWCLLASTLVGAGVSAAPVGDPQQGQEKAETVCMACHGAGGNSTNPQWPKLAGQNAAYLAKQLVNYQNSEQEGGRDNGLMTPQAADLEEQEIADLAAYYAEQKLTLGAADPELIEAGQALYLGGDPERGIPSCSSCHSPRGLGNAAAKFPRLSGQHQEYLSMQLGMFRSGERANDPNNMMRDIAAKLSDADIEALSSYLQGLR